MHDSILCITTQSSNDIEQHHYSVKASDSDAANLGMRVRVINYRATVNVYDISDVLAVFEVLFPSGTAEVFTSRVCFSDLPDEAKRYINDAMKELRESESE